MLLVWTEQISIVSDFRGRLWTYTPYMIEGKVRFACRNICALALGDVAEAIYLYILGTGNVNIGPRPTFAVRLPNRTRGRLGKLAFMGAQTSKFGHSVWGLIGVYYGVPIVSSVPMSPCRRLWQHGECSCSLPSTQFFIASDVVDWSSERRPSWSCWAHCRDAIGLQCKLCTWSHGDDGETTHNGLRGESWSYPWEPARRSTQSLVRFVPATFHGRGKEQHRRLKIYPGSSDNIILTNA